MCVCVLYVRICVVCACLYVCVCELVVSAVFLLIECGEGRVLVVFIWQRWGHACNQSGASTYCFPLAYMA